MEQPRSGQRCKPFDRLANFTPVASGVPGADQSDQRALHGCSGDGPVVRVARVRMTAAGNDVSWCAVSVDVVKAVFLASHAVVELTLWFMPVATNTVTERHRLAIVVFTMLLWITAAAPTGVAMMLMLAMVLCFVPGKAVISWVSGPGTTRCGSSSSAGVLGHREGRTADLNAHAICFHHRLV